MLVQQELIPQERKARNPDEFWRKDMRLLRHKILRPIIFAHGKSGYIGAHRRQRIGRRPASVHVTKIQRIGVGKIVIQAQSELIVILHQSLRIDKSIRSMIRQREKRQHLQRRRIDGREKCELVERHSRPEIRQLSLRIAAQASGRVNRSSGRSAQLAKVTLLFRRRRYGRRYRFTLPVAKAFVISEEESLILN